MLVEKWGARIVASRFSRGAYAALKCVCFCALGVEWIARHTQISVAVSWSSVIHAAVNGIVVATMAFCIFRALPVFWEGLRDFKAAERVNVNAAIRVQPGVVVGATRAVTGVRWTS
jgi:hypothetical protein